MLFSSASSQAASARLDQCCRKYIRSICSRPTGGLPLPAFRSCGSNTLHSSVPGTTFSIVARKMSRLVGRRYGEKLACWSAAAARLCSLMLLSTQMASSWWTCSAFP